MSSVEELNRAGNLMQHISRRRLNFNEILKEAAFDDQALPALQTAPAPSPLPEEERLKRWRKQTLRDRESSLSSLQVTALPECSSKL